MSPTDQLAQNILDFGHTLSVLWVVVVVLIIVIGVPVALIRRLHDEIEMRGWRDVLVSGLKTMAALGFAGLMLYSWLWGTS